MKSDLDRLMAEADLEAIVVFGDKAANPYRDYLTKRSKAQGSVFKRRGEPAIFVVQSGMEIGEAQKSGLQVYTLYDFGSSDLAKQHSSAPDLYARDLFCNILRKLEITGRVAFFGVADINMSLVQFAGLRDCLPDLEPVIGGAASALFSNAYATKDAQEIVALKEAGRLTSQVVNETADFISGHRASGETVVDANGVPLTIGAVKRFIRLRQIELGLDDPEICIFGQGHDAGIAHSHGEDSEALQLGKTIVFDIYPKLTANGYFHDMTRTWCIGHASDEVQAAYDDVMYVFHEAKRTFKVGQVTSTYQNMACDYFESKGHATARSNPGTMDGYVHSLGHGLGLNIHESPFFRQFSEDVLTPGNVFTIEPGLYYPDRGFGIRVEDTVYLDNDGTLHTLTDAPYDLVLPLKG
ncbi:MAG: M24 family metallopeptidase [Chloroflexota bacterium]